MWRIIKNKDGTFQRITPHKNGITYDVIGDTWKDEAEMYTALKRMAKDKRKPSRQQRAREFLLFYKTISKIDSKTANYKY